jgi:membrane-anchored mycosin MYCP
MVAMALTPAGAQAASPAQSLAPGGQCVGWSSNVVHTTPWAQLLLNPGSVWALTQGAGQIVAVIDSGVSAAAPALSGAVLPGRNMVTGGPGDTDCLGDGTFAAGIIAARHTPGAGFTGLAPGARILPVDVVGASGQATSQSVAAGIWFAASSGASVVDVSLAAPPGPSAALRAAVRYAEARNVVVIAPVVSTTGFASPVNQVSYPAAYRGVVAVSAVGPGGSPISAGTPWVRVGLAAPGAQVVSTGPRGRGNLTGGGAGVATAFVAAAAALVRSYYPQLTAAQVVHRLEATVDRPGTALPDPQLGYGIVDPYAAVTAVLPEEWGSRAQAAPAAPALRLPPRPVPVTWPLTAALTVLGSSAVLVTIVAAAIAVVRHGRRRHWRASHWP